MTSRGYFIGVEVSLGWDLSQGSFVAVDVVLGWDSNLEPSAKLQNLEKSQFISTT
jgi:hypothetical protein